HISTRTRSYSVHCCYNRLLYLPEADDDGVVVLVHYPLHLRPIGVSRFGQVLACTESFARTSNKYAAHLLIRLAIIQVTLQRKCHITIETIKLFWAIESEVGYAVLY